MRLGGMGGDGGDVEVVSVEGHDLGQLAHLPSRRFLAGQGEDCTRRRVYGRKGKDLLIKVPPGTVVSDSNKNQVGVGCRVQGAEYTYSHVVSGNTKQLTSPTTAGAA